ncbi:hypothetical protein SAMN03080617_03319 [Algoriphagus alkaliphilus]|uniref:Uncharacterized protein n=1 Tax=Algoriphagus alkaliphilus TaxID=279824 RepID=A0A1G5Z813_9BACT|nr:hypothetical protein SAMN03080617_03319 [Algoriphagus alkaliphilus]
MYLYLYRKNVWGYLLFSLNTDVKSKLYFMIIRNSTSLLKLKLQKADNRRQTTVHSPQLVSSDFYPYFLWLLVRKRINRLYFLP